MQLVHLHLMLVMMICFKMIYTHPQSVYRSLTEELATHEIITESIEQDFSHKELTTAETTTQIMTDKPEESYLLPAGSSNILSKKRINNQLVCEEPGMFADVNNNCQIFHVCHASKRMDGRFDLRQYSFMCGSQLMFDQYSLTCRLKSHSIPCEYSPEFYKINRRTLQGRQNVTLHRKEDVVNVNRYYQESKERLTEKAPVTY